jgi:uncharacterized protein (DUF1015 family)
MAEVRPFAAVVYNQDKVKDLDKVICPPYDVISSQKQQFFYDLHPYNFIRVDFTRDSPGQDKYSKAAGTFEEWLEKQILIQDDKPAVYFYSHQYWIAREKKVRLGFIARLKLDDKKSQDVYGHEHTRTEAKDDRLRLLRAVKANLSPIFIVFADKKRLVNVLWNNAVSKKRPFLDVTDEDRNVHRLWRIDDPKMLDKISALMKTENMFIADGHHRYEVSCAYRDEMRKKKGEITGEEDFNYTLAYFTNIDPTGLTILPIHRLIKLEYIPDIAKIIQALGVHFTAEEVKDRRRFFFLLEKAGRAEHVIGMYYQGHSWLMRLKNVKVLDKAIADKPREYRKLDVSILNTLVLSGAMGVNLENKDNKECVEYIHDRDELLSRADENRKHIAFFLNSTKMEQIVSVALAGEKMPPKSTFFFPKPVCGLLVNRHTAE